MANHSNVITKKKMTLENVTALFNKLNKEVFFECLDIDQSMWYGEEQAWHITIKDPDIDDGFVCWLNTSRHFEVRYCHASDFLWWVAFLIQDQLAINFNGRIEDDGVGKITAFDTPLTWKEYLRKRCERFGYNPILYFTMAKFTSWGTSKIYIKAAKQASKNKFLPNVQRKGA